MTAVRMVAVTAVGLVAVSAFGLVAASVTLPGRLAGDARDRVRASHALAACAALAVVAVARSGALSLALATGATLALVAALGRRWPDGVVLAGGGLFAAALVVAATSGDALATLVGAFGAVLAADFGTFALGVERDTDPAVATTRVELLHAVGSATVALLTAGVGYALFRSAPAGSGLGVVALLFAAVVLAVALRS